LTLQNWKKFCTEFEIHRNRVEDWTEVEEYNLLLKNLSSYWRKKIVQEENKKKRTQFWVRFTGVNEENPQEVVRNLK